MGTRSNIGILEKNGSVTMSYCHWDGYPSWNGHVLLNNYNSEQKARSVVALGSLSSLCENLEPPVGVKHTFDKPLDNVTVAHHRDRKEKWVDCKPTKYPSIKEARRAMQEYLYLWDVAKGKWVFTDGKIGLVELTEEACQEI